MSLCVYYTIMTFYVHVLWRPCSKNFIFSFEMFYICFMMGILCTLGGQ